MSYLTPRLLKPLGIRKTIWEVDPEGNTFGAGGLFLTVSELHKLGMFYLQNGCWNGKKLLSKEWIHESTRKQVENNKTLMVMDTYSGAAVITAFWPMENMVNTP